MPCYNDFLAVKFEPLWELQLLLQDFSRFVKADLIYQCEQLFFSHLQLLLPVEKINIIGLLTKSMIQVFAICGHSMHAWLILVADAEDYVTGPGQIHEHLWVKPWSCSEAMAEEDGNNFHFP